MSIDCALHLLSYRFEARIPQFVRNDIREPSSGLISNAGEIFLSFG